MPRSGDQIPTLPETAHELRARAARYRELAKQYYADQVVDRMLELAAELEERAAAIEKTVKPDGADQ